jgi:uncharacterized protein YneF (UPF0154 family)
MELIISLFWMICLILFGTLSAIKFARKEFNKYIDRKVNEKINANRSNGKH